MKKPFLSLLLLVFCGTTPLHADSIPIKDVPAPVINAAQEYFPGSQILSAERDSDNGQMRYEAILRYKDIKLEVDFLETGRILDVEMEN